MSVITTQHDYIVYLLPPLQTIMTSQNLYDFSRLA